MVHALHLITWNRLDNMDTNIPNGAGSRVAMRWWAVAAVATSAGSVARVVWRGSRNRRAARERLVRRIAAEFAEMPGMMLTMEQACRLLGVSVATGERVLRELVLQGVLRHTPSGRYVRAAAS